jgi:hypothetical protein
MLLAFKEVSAAPGADLPRGLAAERLPKIER